MQKLGTPKGGRKLPEVADSERSPQEILGKSGCLRSGRKSEIFIGGKRR